MSRLLPLSLLPLFVCAATVFTGCNNMYRDVYSPKRNYFVPPAEKKVELPPETRTTPPPAVMATPTMTPPPAEAGAGAGAGAGAAGIPGMDPIPGLQ